MEQGFPSRFCAAAALLPPELKARALTLSSAAAEEAEELRLRAGQPVCVSLNGGETSLGGAPVTAEQLRSVLEIASCCSAHTVLDKVQNGYVTVRGGHRIGICGTAAVENGRVKNIRQISSLSIRIAREIRGEAPTLLRRLCDGGRLYSTLLLSPPGVGKTTLLRDMIRCISSGEGVPPMRVGVADERGELAALWEGVPQMELGPRCDVMDGCAKAAGLLMLLRGMTPQVLAADEITSEEDIDAMLQICGCGVSLLATAHAGSAADLRRRPVYRRLLAQGVFQRAVVLRRVGTARTSEIISLEGFE